MSRNAWVISNTLGQTPVYPRIFWAIIAWLNFAKDRTMVFGVLRTDKEMRIGVSLRIYHRTNSPIVFQASDHSRCEARISAFMTRK
jgi:hypothetical protein